MLLFYEQSAALPVRKDFIPAYVPYAAKWTDERKALPKQYETGHL